MYTKEQRKLYNAEYRKNNGDRVEKYLATLITCQNCGRVTRFQNVLAHKRTAYCKNHSHKPDETIIINKIKASKTDKEILQVLEQLIIGK